MVTIVSNENQETTVSLFQIKFPFFIFPTLITKHVIVESSKGLYSFCAYSFFHFAVLWLVYFLSSIYRSTVYLQMYYDTNW